MHTGGTGILTWKDTETDTYGEAPSTEPYDDLEGVSRCTSLPDTAFHRNVDKIVLATSSNAVKTAVICPPTIYGPGRGTVNKRSRQVYSLVEIALDQGQAPMLGKGLTEWDNVHVHDLADVYVLLVEAAIAAKPELDGHLWGKEGYFFAENGHHIWGEVSKQVGKIAFEKGYIKEEDAKAANVEEIKELAGFEGLSWGLNSKGFAKRARKYLGWKPHARSLEEELPYIVDLEAERKGLKPGHALVAQGKA